jgi:hypothetical protein
LLNKGNAMFILVYVTKGDNDSLVSHYTTFETLEDGQLAYNHIRNYGNVYSASLCKPIASTEAHYLD